MLTGLEVVIAPLLSVALAVNVWLFAAALLECWTRVRSGGVESLMHVAPSKNCTLATVPGAVSLACGSDGDVSRRDETGIVYRAS